MSDQPLMTPKYHVVIALSHDMGQFFLDRVLGDEESDAMVEKLRGDGLNAYRRIAYWENAGFTTQRIYP